MSDLVGNADFDVESQQLLLQTPSETTARLQQNVQRIIWLLRFTELFKLAADNPPCYSPIENRDHDKIKTGGSEIAANEQPQPEPHADPSYASCVSQDEKASDKLQLLQKESIIKIVKGKKLCDLCNFGGVQGVAEALGTDLEDGKARGPKHKPQCKISQLREVLAIFQFILEACNNYNIFLLFVASVLSLTFGIIEEGVKEGWYDGAIVMGAIIILVIFTTARNYWQQRSSKKGGSIEAQVIRGGKKQVVFAADLSAGDIVLLERGCLVPGDGIFVNGKDFKLGTGSRPSSTTDEHSPFLFYGDEVINGTARMIVTSVSNETVCGEMMSKGMESPEKKCTFESCLHKLSTCIQITGLLISILIIIVLFLRHIKGKIDEEHGLRPDTKDDSVRVKKILESIKGMIIGSKGRARILTTLSISLIGIMEGIPVVVSIGITLWNWKILADKGCVNNLLACVKMESVTAICTDKFGGMRPKMEVRICVDGQFVRESSIVASDVFEALCDGIGTSISVISDDCEPKVEPLALWAKEKLGMKGESISQTCRIIDSKGTNPFDVLHKVLIERSGNEQMELYLHYQGRPRDILQCCKYCYDNEGGNRTIDDQEKRGLEHFVEAMLDGRQVIAYACKRKHDSHDRSLEANDLIFLGVTFLEEINQEDTRKEVTSLREGKIRTILVSSDDVSVLRAIGQDCGLLAPDDLVLTSDEFRGWTDAEKNEKLDKICIIGNCLPSDKVLLLKWLREKGEVVAFLGQEKNDAPALKEADIGLAVGTWSSRIARESSDIIIWVEQLSFLVDLVQKGRCIYENIRKFIQVELIMTIAGSLINFIGSIFLGDAPLTAFPLFWLNLMVTVAGGLALLTEPPTERLMQETPVKLSGHLLTKAMRRNIAVQASYQAAIFVTLQHKGHAMLGISEEHVKSLIYNGFFICQLFNIIIARELEDKNIFKGLCRNRWFWVALIVHIASLALSMVAEAILVTSPWSSWTLLGFLIGLASLFFDWGAKSISSCIYSYVA